MYVLARIQKYNMYNLAYFLPSPLLYIRKVYDAASKLRDCMSVKTIRQCTLVKQTRAQPTKKLNNKVR